jgi:hypothetical protein
VDAVKKRLATLAQTTTASLKDVDKETIPALPEELLPSEPLGYKFLAQYIEHSRKWSPRAVRAMHEATALWVLSAAAAGRVRYYDGDERKTTLYQLVVAESTLYTKSTCAKIGRKLLEAAGLKRVLIGKATPQSFFEQCLEKVPQDYEQMPDRLKDVVRENLVSVAQRGWYADEFGAIAVGLLNPNSTAYQFLEMLLEIYDGPSEYSSSTRTYGTQSMIEPTLSLLGSTTWAHLSRLAYRGSPLWRDGLLARMAVVTPAPDEGYSMERWPEGMQTFPASLVETLRDFDQRLGKDTIRVVARRNAEQEQNGPKQSGRRPAVYDIEREPCPKYVVELSTEAVDESYAYDAWVREQIATPRLLPMDLAPSYGRLRDRALRIAVLLCSIEGRLKVTVNDWQKALAIVERQRYALHYAYDELVGKSAKWQEETFADEVYQYIASKGVASLRDIRRKFNRRKELETVDKARKEMEAICKEYNVASATGPKKMTLYAVREEDFGPELRAQVGQKS